MYLGGGSSLTPEMFELFDANNANQLDSLRKSLNQHGKEILEIIEGKSHKVALFVGYYYISSPEELLKEHLERNKKERACALTL